MAGRQWGGREEDIGVIDCHLQHCLAGSALEAKRIPAEVGRAGWQAK